MNHLVSAFLVSSVLAVPTIAATLRPMTSLGGPAVRVSDLFDDAGAAGPRILGPAPAPGARIVVEAPQLSAIARQFGVDWQAASAADRVVLDRPARMVPREDIAIVLRAALAGLGAPEDAAIELPGFQSPLVPAETHAELAIEQLDYDPAGGRFTGTLAIAGAGMELQRMRLSGTAQEMVSLPVPAHRLLAGAVIQAEDLQTAHLRAGLARGEVARAPAQAIGMAVRHQMLAGQPLALADLLRPAAVRRGALVMMQLRSPGIALTGQGQALEAGAIGEAIRVLNPVSRMVISAEITGPDEVRVLPGSAPVPAGLRPPLAVVSAP